MLQNINPAGGLVIGAFNVLGAVLEEDLNLFRYLSPTEIEWPNGASVAASNSDGGEIIVRASGSVGVGAEHRDTCENVSYDTHRPMRHRRERFAHQSPIHEDPLYKDHIAIRHYATATDVYEASHVGVPTSPYYRADYIARRFSDGAYYHLPFSTAAAVGKNAKGGRVPFTLPSVFDFEIISFAPLLRLSNGVNVAAIGAVDKYNRFVYMSVYLLHVSLTLSLLVSTVICTMRSGGAVLKVEDTSGAEPAQGSELLPSPAQYTVHLLGTGSYSLVIAASDILEVEVKLEGYTVLYTRGPSIHVSLVEVKDASVNRPSNADSMGVEDSGGKYRFIEVRLLIETLPTQGANSDSGGGGGEEGDAGAIVTLGIYRDKKQ